MTEKQFVTQSVITGLGGQLFLKDKTPCEDTYQR
jgi:hypothetical protein